MWRGYLQSYDWQATPCHLGNQERQPLFSNHVRNAGRHSAQAISAVCLWCFVVLEVCHTGIFLFSFLPSPFPSAASTQPVCTRLVLNCRSFCSSSRVFVVWLLSSLWEEMLWRGSGRAWGRGGWATKESGREKKGISHPVRGVKWATLKRPRREPEGKTEQPARVGTGAVGRELKWRNVSVCTLAQAAATRPRRYWKETRRSSRETMMWPRSFVCSLLRYCWLHKTQLFSMSSQGHLVHDQSLRWSAAPLCLYLSSLPTLSRGPPRALPCSSLSSAPVELRMVTPMRMMSHHPAILLQDLLLLILNHWLKQMCRAIHRRHTTVQMRSTHRLF